MTSSQRARRAIDVEVTDPLHRSPAGGQGQGLAPYLGPDLGGAGIWSGETSKRRSPAEAPRRREHELDPGIELLTVAANRLSPRQPNLRARGESHETAGQAGFEPLTD